MENRMRDTDAYFVEYDNVEPPEATLSESMMDDIAEALSSDAMIDMNDSDWMVQDPSFLDEMSVTY